MKLQTEPGAWTSDVAVDPAAGSLFATAYEPSPFHPELRQWDSSGNPVASVALPGQNIDGVAVDGSRHRVYLVDKETNEVLVYAPPSPLTVNVTGAGGVESNPSGISCQADESCTAELAGPVTLTASPAPGHVFAGWLGCKKTSANTCTVTIDGETEVTAVFLKDGTTGPSGPQGGTGAAGSNGAKGSDGAAGPQGPQGRQGPPPRSPARSRAPKNPRSPARLRRTQPPPRSVSAGVSCAAARRSVKAPPATAASSSAPSRPGTTG